MTLLERLQCDYDQISAIIKAHNEDILNSSHDTVTLNTLHEVYLDTLEDALKTITLMIDYLKKVHGESLDRKCQNQKA